MARETRNRAGTAGIAFAHEAVELFLVLGTAKFTDILVKLLAHFIEFAALLVEAGQFSIAPVVEGNVAGAEARTAIALPLALEGRAKAVDSVVGVLLEGFQPFA